ncbi:unnamed protein product [Prorocentrum cordatum]|uniref:Uncharacterized protein n=1 Tax=Prorocentrum cordatum TaxID=2364126 RepID=A0ABN9QEW7_9DINO|nr:unnamed protein product [Polarella glacialis]
MAEPDDLLRLARPPTFSGKEDEWTEWSSVMRSYAAVQAPEMTHLIEAAESAARPDITLDNIQQLLGAGGVAAAKKLFHILVMSTALSEWEETVRKWETISGDRFNASMKKALFIDKAPKSVKTLLRMQSSDTYEQMTMVTLHFMQSNAQYLAGVPVPPRPRRERDPNAMEVDAPTRKCKDAKGKDKLGRGKGKDDKNGNTINIKADWIKDAECFICRKKGHLAADCWHNPKGKPQDSKGKGKRGTKKGINELTSQEPWIAWKAAADAFTAASSAGAPSTSASQAPGHVAKFTYHEHEGDYETSHIFAITARSNQANYVGYNVGPWFPMSVLVDNCADEHVCGPEDFYRRGIQRSADPNLEAANGHKIRHYDERSVKLKLNDGNNIIITFQVCDVTGPILSVGKFCGDDSKRNANFNMNGGTLYHEAAGEVNVDREKNHYALQRWVEKPGVVAPLSAGGSSGSAPAGQAAPAPQGDEPAPQQGKTNRFQSKVEQEVAPVQTLPGPEEPSKEEFEMHNLLHDPPMPWCEIYIKAKGRDACHHTPHQKPMPVIQLDYAEAGSGDSAVPNFEFIVGVDMSTGAAWASAVLVTGKEDVYAKAWTMQSPPCEVILQQPQRHSHQSNGGAERMVPTIRNQMKAYKIHIETNTGMTILPDSPLLTWFPRHAAWQHTRFHKRQDSGMTAYEKISRAPYQKPIPLAGETAGPATPPQGGGRVEEAKPERKDNLERKTRFHRTKLCQYHLHGRCSKRDKCDFAHGEAELLQARRAAGSACGDTAGQRRKAADASGRCRDNVSTATTPADAALRHWPTLRRTRADAGGAATRQRQRHHLRTSGSTQAADHDRRPTTPAPTEQLWCVDGRSSRTTCSGRSSSTTYSGRSKSNDLLRSEQFNDLLRFEQFHDLLGSDLLRSTSSPLPPPRPSSPEKPRGGGAVIQEACGDARAPHGRRRIGSTVKSGVSLLRRKIRT